MPMAALATQQRALTRRSRTHAIAQLLTLAPLAVLVTAAAFPQAPAVPSTQPLPQLLGAPAELVVGSLALLWMFAGTLVVRYATSPLMQSLALAVFTIPATIGAALAPVLLLVLLNRA